MNKKLSTLIAGSIVVGTIGLTGVLVGYYNNFNTISTVKPLIKQTDLGNRCLDASLFDRGLCLSHLSETSYNLRDSKYELKK